MNNKQEHSLCKTHNEEDYEKSSYLFSLFGDNCENADELIIDFANKYDNFMVHCYIGNVFETTSDAFMLSVIFNKKNVVEKLMETNKHKLDKSYTYGLGMYTTPRELIEMKGDVFHMM
jgi:hypothetical protein